MKVVIVAAMTADGFIARDPEHRANWTGKADKKLFVRITKEMGVVVMGANTFATLQKALPERRTIVYTSRPDEIHVEDIETTSESPADLVARLKREGAAGIAVIGGASVYGLFMEANVVDELYITVVPRLFGTGVPLFRTSLDVRMDLLEHNEMEDGRILLHYSVKH